MGAVVGLLIVAVLAIISPPVSRGDEVAPKVRLLDPSPLTLKGVGFADRERVRLTVHLGERTVIRKLLARATGSFRVTFPAIEYSRCSGELSVVAIGSRGSRVSWTLVPLDCPQNNASARVDS